MEWVMSFFDESEENKRESSKPEYAMHARGPGALEATQWGF